MEDKNLELKNYNNKFIKSTIFFVIILLIIDFLVYFIPNLIMTGFGSFILEITYKYPYIFYLFIPYVTIILITSISKYKLKLLNESGKTYYALSFVALFFSLMAPYFVGYFWIISFVLGVMALQKINKQNIVIEINKKSSFNGFGLFGSMINARAAIWVSIFGTNFTFLFAELLPILKGMV